MNTKQTKVKLKFLASVMLILVVVLGVAMPDSPPPPPQQLPPTGNCFDDNIFYGAIPPGGEQNRVLVFVHGLSGLAEDWWSDNTLAGLNDMYILAHDAGYRTAFVNLNIKLSNPGNCSVERRPADDMMGAGLVLSRQLDTITQYYDVSQVDIISHSKGGIDTQAAIVWNGAWQQVRNVFTLGSPHQGSLLADLLWSPEGFWVSILLGQRDDATYSLRTASMQLFRSTTDPSSVDDNIRYYSGAGDFWETPDSLFEVTGEWLQNQPDGGDNDGVVTVAHTALSGATPLFLQPWNHAEVYQGHNAFPYIHQILLDDAPDDFKVYLPLIIRHGAFNDTSLEFAESGYLKGTADEVSDTLKPLQSNYIVRGGRLTESTIEFIPIEPQASGIRFSLLTTDEQVTATLSSPTVLTYPLMTVPNKGQGIFDNAFLLSRVVDQPTPGQWNIQIDGPAGTGYLLIVTLDSQLQVSLDGVPSQPIPPGKAVELTAWGETPMSTVQVDQLTMRVIRSASEPGRVNIKPTMVKSGSSLSHIFVQEDMYGISITVTGQTTGGLPFERSFVRSLAVVPAQKLDSDLTVLDALMRR